MKATISSLLQGLAAASLLAGLASGALADFQSLWTAGGVIAAPSPGLYQGGIKALPDGASGVFLVWTEYAHYTPSIGWTGGDIRAQHLDKNGNPLWGASGVAVCAADGEQDSPTAASDGAGGIIVAWADSRAGATDTNIYAQRILSDGSPQWIANGVPVCSALNIQQHPVICTDGAHGAIVAWEDFRSSLGPITEEDIYAQRVLADGSMSWTPEGVAVMKAAGVHFGPLIVSQAGGGAIVGWTDNGTTNVADVKAAEVSATGSAGSHVIVCNAAGDQVLNDLKPDGQGGYLFAWYDYRNGTTNADVYAQRMNASLAPQWGANGLGVATETFDEYEPILIPNGDGSAELEYLAAGNGVDVLGAKVSSAGAVSWTGKPICNAIGDQTAPSAASDGAAGVITGWQDSRTNSPDVYVQHFTGTGGMLWPDNGSPVAASVYYEQSPCVVTDGAGGAIVAWEDWHDISAGQVYAQRIADASGGPDTTPPTTPIVTLSAGYANNASSVTISWSSTDPESGISGYEYGVGTTSGATDVKAFTAMGTATSTSLSTAGLAEGSYYVAVRATNGVGLTSTGASSALVIDNTPPTVNIAAPAVGAFVMGNVAVTGTVSDAHFDHATLESGAGASPSSYTTISTLSSPVSSGSLGAWNTSLLSPGVYTLRLTAVDKAGNTAQASRSVTVYLPGDVDGDGAVTIHDVAALLAAAAGLTPANGLMIAAGDMAPKPSSSPSGYGDGSISILDALRVLRAVHGLDSLP
ncbi:MAG TPA: hypothetical protein VGM51_06640 [Armatimonadota bacterium]|jgi:hypothetical protein